MTEIHHKIRLIGFARIGTVGQTLYASFSRFAPQGAVRFTARR
jgi:hypothetical protein